MSKIKEQADRISIIGIALIITIISFAYVSRMDNWKYLLNADAKAYYFYLPATFIYHDLNYGFFDEVHENNPTTLEQKNDFRSNYKDQKINKYYCGNALVRIPFFLSAHLIANISDYSTDGFSKPYLMSIGISGICFLLMALIFMNKWLRIYNFNSLNRAIALVAIVFGSNLFYYTVREPGMSHVASLGFISMLLFFVKKYFLTFDKKLVIPIALTLGIIVLIRPINGIIILLIPFLAGKSSTLIQGWKHLLRLKKELILGSLGFLVLLSIQIVVYKISTGSFIIYSYQSEGFNFLHPHFIDFLFSYRKGLFVYAPLLFVSMLGGIIFWKASRSKLGYWMFFFIILTYSLSSWWNWWYGGSFGSRVFIEFLPLFIFMLAMALQNMKPKYLKKYFLTIIFLLVMVNMIQTLQYHYNYLSMDEMTKEMYWDIFLRIPHWFEEPKIN